MQPADDERSLPVSRNAGIRDRFPGTRSATADSPLRNARRLVRGDGALHTPAPDPERLGTVVARVADQPRVGFATEGSVHVSGTLVGGHWGRLGGAQAAPRTAASG